MLPTVNTQVLTTFEPSDGTHPNYGLNTSHNDDSGASYLDSDFFGMCGPGAADIALWYWPKPANLMGPVSVKDPKPGVTTVWTSERMRAYMTHIAWQIKAPSWSYSGMLDTTAYPTWGVNLYRMADGLNWEASGEDTSNWANYFYYLQWWNQSNESGLHNDVVSDVYSNNVPVVAEVDTAYLLNWSPQKTLNRFITIIGYNDTAGTYTYTDTCASSTNCNDTGNGSDGGQHTVSQHQMWLAISAIQVNTTNTPAHGDGGWVW